MEPFIYIAACSTTPAGGSLDARKLMGKLYRQTTGEQMPPLLREDRGKPYFSGGSLHCSITHTRSMAFCALATMPVGLDAEERNRRVRPGIPEKALSVQELAQWQASADPAQTFLRLWTLKEATVKFTGDGLRGYPRHLSFQIRDGQPVLPGSGFSYRLWQYAGHWVALCAGQPLPEQCRFVTI